MVVRGLIRATLGVVVVVSAALGVAGCGQHAQSAEQAPGEAVAVHPQDALGPRIPEGYQSDDCPLPTGELVSAIGSEGTYTLTYTVEDAAAFDALLAQYDALGYERVATTQPEMFKAAMLTSGRWRVTLAYPEVAGFTLSITATLI